MNSCASNTTQKHSKNLRWACLFHSCWSCELEPLIWPLHENKCLDNYTCSPTRPMCFATSRRHPGVKHWISLLRNPGYERAAISRGAVAAVDSLEIPAPVLRNFLFWNLLSSTYLHALSHRLSHPGQQYHDTWEYVLCSSNPYGNVTGIWVSKMTLNLWKQSQPSISGFPHSSLQEDPLVNKGLVPQGLLWTRWAFPGCHGNTQWGDLTTRHCTLTPQLDESGLWSLPQQENQPLSLKDMEIVW